MPPAPPNDFQQPVLQSSIACTGCGYDLSGTPVGGRCPECGTPVTETIRPLNPPRTSGYAVASFVVGLVSLVTCFLLIGPVALYLAVRARREMAGGNFTSASHTFARIGGALGALATVLLVLVAILMIAGI